MRVVASDLVASVPVSVLSIWLGFSSPDTCRRFIRKEFGLSVKRLRACAGRLEVTTSLVRKGPVFLVIEPLTGFTQ